MTGSVYGVPVGLVVTALLMGRIAGEEKLLTKGLEGYKEYSHKVCYRLIPLIW